MFLKLTQHEAIKKPRNVDKNRARDIFRKSFQLLDLTHTCTLLGVKLCIKESTSLNFTDIAAPFWLQQWSD